MEELTTRKHLIHEGTSFYEIELHGNKVDTFDDPKVNKGNTVYYYNMVIVIKDGVYYSSLYPCTVYVNIRVYKIIELWKNY